MCYLCMGKDESTIERVHGGWPGKWVASAQSGNPPDPYDPANAAQPAAAPITSPAPAKPGVFGGTRMAMPMFGPGKGPQPITVVNSTTDPRILWEDGKVAVIYAKDFPAGTGMGRSRTRAGLVEVLSAPIDDQLQTAPGKGSAFEFVKVWLKEILARPIANNPAATVVGRIANDPKQLVPRAPVVASSGTFKGQVIPDFPHTCAACGGKCYQGMFSNVHDTLDGRCPSEKRETKKGR